MDIDLKWVERQFNLCDKVTQLCEFSNGLGWNGGDWTLLHPENIAFILQKVDFATFVWTEKTAAKRSNWLVLPYNQQWSVDDYLGQVNKAFSGAVEYNVFQPPGGFLKAHYMLQDGWTIKDISAYSSLPNVGYVRAGLCSLGSYAAMNTLRFLREMWPHAEEMGQEKHLVDVADHLINIHADCMTDRVRVLLERMLKSTIYDNEPRRDK